MTNVLGRRQLLLGPLFMLSSAAISYAIFKRPRRGITTGMTRRLLLPLMLFVLLWTSTLLHDIVEPDENVAIEPTSTATAIAPVSLLVSNQEISTEGHFHDALLESKFDPKATHLQAPQVALMAVNCFYTDKIQFANGQLGQRGPPATNSAVKPRLYLIYRVLLI